MDFFQKNRFEVKNRFGQKNANSELSRHTQTAAHLRYPQVRFRRHIHGSGPKKPGFGLKLVVFGEKRPFCRKECTFLKRFPRKLDTKIGIKNKSLRKLYSKYLIFLAQSFQRRKNLTLWCLCVKCLFLVDPVWGGVGTGCVAKATLKTLTQSVKEFLRDGVIPGPHFPFLSHSCLASPSSVRQMVGSHYLQKQDFSGQKPCYEENFFFSKIQIFHSFFFFFFFKILKPNFSVFETGKPIF